MCKHACVFGRNLSSSVSMVDDNVSGVTLATLLSSVRHNCSLSALGGLEKAHRSEGMVLVMILKYHACYLSAQIHMQINGYQPQAKDLKISQDTKHGEDILCSTVDTLSTLSLSVMMLFAVQSEKKNSLKFSLTLFL